MTILTDVTRAAANTSTGNQSFTLSNLGATPKAAMFYITYGSTDGTAANDAGFGIGFTDGTREVAFFTSTEDGVTPTDMINDSTAASILIQDAGTATVLGKATIVSFSSNTVTVNWTTAPSTAYLVTVVAFAGTGLSAYANYAAISGTVDTETHINTVGFEPDLVLTAMNGSTVDSATSANNGMSIGAAYNSGVSVTQRSIGARDRNAQTTVEAAARMTESYSAMELETNGALTSGIDLTTFDSAGFSAYPRTGGAGSSLGYLALSFGGEASVSVGTYDTPTATGNASSTAPGFTPQMVGLLMSACSAVDTAEVDNDGGQMGASVFTANAEYSNAGAWEDGLVLGTTNTQSVSDDQAVNLDDDDGTNRFDATYVSLDANGWTLNFSATDGTARKWVYWAIGTTSTNPTITDAGDEDFDHAETAVTITGTNFGASQGSGDVQICTGTGRSGTCISQTVTSWGDTSIQVTIDQGSSSATALPNATNLYLSVKDNGLTVSNDWTIQLSTARYHIYQDDVDTYLSYTYLTEPTSGSPYTVTGLTQNTTYKYTISLESATGTESTLSSPKYITTQSENPDPDIRWSDKIGSRLLGRAWNWKIFTQDT